MESSYIIKYDPQSAVPSDPAQRVAWLDRFGVLPTDAALTIVLPLRDWLRMGVAPNSAGKIEDSWPNRESLRDARYAVQAAAVAIVAETGQIVTELPATVLASVVASLEAAIAAKQAKAKAEAEAEAKAKAEKLAEEMAAPIDTYLVRRDGAWKPTGLDYNHPRNKDVLAEAERRNQAEADAYAECIGMFVAEHGTLDQCDRYEAGVLPQAELDTMLREFVFQGMADLARYEKIRKSDIEHDSDYGGEHEVSFSASEQGPLTTEQFAVLTEIQEASPTGAEVEVRKHVGYCQDDSCPEVVRRLSALVTVTWNGRELSREFALPGEPVTD